MLNFAKLTTGRENYNWRKKNILIIDPDPSSRTLHNHYLSREGANCHFSKNFEEAVSIIRSTRIDLILTEIHMLNLNKYQPLRDLSQELGIPVVIQTSLVTQWIEDICIYFNCDDYVTKPINWKNYLRIIDKQINSTTKIKASPFLMKPLA